MRAGACGSRSPVRPPLHRGLVGPGVAPRGVEATRRVGVRRFVLEHFDPRSCRAVVSMPLPHPVSGFCVLGVGKRRSSLSATDRLRAMRRARRDLRRAIGGERHGDVADVQPVGVESTDRTAGRTSMLLAIGALGVGSRSARRSPSSADSADPSTVRGGRRAPETMRCRMYPRAARRRPLCLRLGVGSLGLVEGRRDRPRSARTRPTIVPRRVIGGPPTSRWISNAISAEGNVRTGRRSPRSEGSSCSPSSSSESSIARSRAAGAPRSGLNGTAVGAGRAASGIAARPPPRRGNTKARSSRSRGARRRPA